MNRLFDNSITIYEAMLNIKNEKYIMPAFQRQYVWNMEQIEKLWDSILQDFPISTFLFWHIDDNNVSYDTKFCNFMKDVRFNNSKIADNVNYETVNVDLNVTDTAVLDGQQRLTSLYISLFGDTGIMQKYQRKSSTSQSVAKLLIELNKNKITIDEEYNKKKYDISFATKTYNSSSLFEIKSILNENFKNVDSRKTEIEKYVEKIPLDSQQYARDLLTKLCSKVYDEKLIRYTEIFDMNHEDALEMFVRFNSGGRPLKKSDITMSILEVYWSEAKTYFGQVLTGPYSGFSTDFIIRTALMIYGDVIKSNINKQVVDDLKGNWGKFKIAIKETANIISGLNINMSRFSNSWNVLIPIIYSIYFNPHYESFIDGIKAYLYRAIFFTFFKSGTTSKLQNIKTKMLDNENKITKELMDDMYELRVTVGKIEDLMHYEKESRMAEEILYYLSLPWINNDIHYEVDHLHPYERFNRYPPYGIIYDKWSEWRKMSNRLPNLHLLEGVINASKSNNDLESYLNCKTEEQRKEFLENALIPEDVPLSIQYFDKYYEKRKSVLVQKIKELIM